MDSFLGESKYKEDLKQSASFIECVILIASGIYAISLISLSKAEEKEVLKVVFFEETPEFESTH